MLVASESESQAKGPMAERVATKQVEDTAPSEQLSSKSKPRHIQDLLCGTAASRWYERCGSGACDQYASDASSRSTCSGETRSESGRRGRFLQEEDRCDIIRRLAKGEKQANLAREFKVTRAAICHIKKNRARILAKSNQRDARYSKRTRYVTISKPLVTQLDDISALPIVYEVRSLPMMTLLTALRNRETRLTKFRQSADRAIRWVVIHRTVRPDELLLEEALACVEANAVGLIAPSGNIFEGVQAMGANCGVCLGEDALPMLESFRAINPDTPTGYVWLSAVTNANTSTRTEFNVKLPVNIERHFVYLMAPTCPTGWKACAAVRILLDHGVQESRIFLVCIVTSEMATSVICQRYPAIRIVTAAIDPDVNAFAVYPGIGDFHLRYTYPDTRAIANSDCS